MTRRILLAVAVAYMAVAAVVGLGPRVDGMAHQINDMAHQINDMAYLSHHNFNPFTGEFMGPWHRQQASMKADIDRTYCGEYPLTPECRPAGSASVSIPNLATELPSVSFEVYFDYNSATISQFSSTHPGAAWASFDRYKIGRLPFYRGWTY